MPGENYCECVQLYEMRNMKTQEKKKTRVQRDDKVWESSCRARSVDPIFLFLGCKTMKINNEKGNSSQTKLKKRKKKFSFSNSMQIRSTINILYTWKQHIFFLIHNFVFINYDASTSRNFFLITCSCCPRQQLQNLNHILNVWYHSIKSFTNYYNYFLVWISN